MNLLTGYLFTALKSVKTLPLSYDMSILCPSKDSTMKSYSYLLVRKTSAETILLVENLIALYEFPDTVFL